jgi:[ribosomal protein S5]-alanine N-acetyltransferase
VGQRLGTTERLDVRRPSGRDRAEVVDAAIRSRDLHHPWLKGPVDAEAFNTYLRRLRSRRHHGFLLRARDDGTVVGIVNVSDAIFGNFRSAHLSYYAFAGHEGRGLMAEGVRWVVQHAFTELGLHRLEANIQPGNEPSRRLAEACGFRLEGFSPNYLTVDGDWRDHERWAITAEDLSAGGTAPGP